MEKPILVKAHFEMIYGNYLFEIKTLAGLGLILTVDDLSQTPIRHRMLYDPDRGYKTVKDCYHAISEFLAEEEYHNNKLSA